MQAKLNPFNDAKISFPGFQRIMDYTSAGGDIKTLTVDGDTDKEYIIVTSGNGIILLINNDSGSNYGQQYLYNSAGTITAARASINGFIGNVLGGLYTINLLTPTGFIKTAKAFEGAYASGATVSSILVSGWVWNNTANVTSLVFKRSGANLGAGDRIIVYARRS